MTLDVQNNHGRVTVRHALSPDEIARRSPDPTSEQKFLLRLQSSGLAYQDGNSPPNTVWVLTPLAVEVFSRQG